MPLWLEIGGRGLVVNWWKRGGFRVPDVMSESGLTLLKSARLIEQVADYKPLVVFDTALLLKVHPSNYKSVVSQKRYHLRFSDLEVPVVADLGSGL